MPRRLPDSSDEHADVAPDLFTAETPLGTYQGMTEVVLSRTPAAFKTVLVAARLETDQKERGLRGSGISLNQTPRRGVHRFQTGRSHLNPEADN
jgi:hypothetical protein